MVGTLQDQGSREPIPVLKSCLTSLLENLHCDSPSLAFLHCDTNSYTYSSFSTRLLDTCIKEFVTFETVPPLIIGQGEVKVEVVIDGTRIPYPPHRDNCYPSFRTFRLKRMDHTDIKCKDFSSGNKTHTYGTVTFDRLV